MVDLKLPTEKELRSEFSGYDSDGDLCWTIHVKQVQKLIKDYYLKGLEEGRKEVNV